MLRKASKNINLHQRRCLYNVTFSHIVSLSVSLPLFHFSLGFWTHCKSAQRETLDTFTCHNRVSQPTSHAWIISAFVIKRRLLVTVVSILNLHSLKSEGLSRLYQKQLNIIVYICCGLIQIAFHNAHKSCCQNDDRNMDFPSFSFFLLLYVCLLTSKLNFWVAAM